jgi:chromosome segregation ATPase
MARPPTLTREEPLDDDLPPQSNRVDVVDVAPPTAARAMVTIRRELARLSQQAHAVEKSMEDSGRDRRDALDRLDRATQRILVLEARLAGTEAETNSMRRLHEAALEELRKTRSERDETAQILQTARGAIVELSRSRAEADRFRTVADEATKKAAALEAELAETRRRQFQDALKATDKDTEVGKLRDHIERAEAASVQARDAAERHKEEVTKARQEAADARDAATKLREELATAREDAAHERASEAARVERLMKDADEAAKASASQIDTLEQSVVAAKDAEAVARDELVLAKGELDATRLDRDAADERASRVEGELSAVRLDEARLREQLEAALATATQATARADVAERTHTTLLQGMKQLHDEIIAGFARNGLPASPERPTAPPAENVGSPNGSSGSDVKAT